MVNVITSTTLDNEVKDTLIRNGILFKRALEFGSLFLLAENGIGKHPNSNLEESYKKKIERLLNRITKLIKND